MQNEWQWMKLEFMHRHHGLSMSDNVGDVGWTSFIMYKKWTFMNDHESWNTLYEH